ncbi:MAG: ferritin, partial [Streptosporangiales bacterium]|nr:ferritin [Streptosporangiales bacterium]
QIAALAKAARDDGDYVGEQFLQWFLKEQVEEVAQMDTLLTIVDRAGDNLFHVEDFLAREIVGDEGADANQPAAAGGAL